MLLIVPNNVSRGVLPSASYFDTFIKFFLIDLIKCKEMFINFLLNSNSSPNPIVIGIITL